MKMAEDKHGFSCSSKKIGMVLVGGSMLCSYAALLALGGSAGITIWFLSWIPFSIGVYLSGKTVCPRLQTC